MTFGFSRRSGATQDSQMGVRSSCGKVPHEKVQQVAGEIQTLSATVLQQASEMSDMAHDQKGLLDRFS